jgi:hypothetical protein
MFYNMVKKAIEEKVKLKAASEKFAARTTGVAMCPPVFTFGEHDIL